MLLGVSFAVQKKNLFSFIDSWYHFLCNFCFAWKVLACIFKSYLFCLPAVTYFIFLDLQTNSILENVHKSDLFIIQQSESYTVHLWEFTTQMFLSWALTVTTSLIHFFIWFYYRVRDKVLDSFFCMWITIFPSIIVKEVLFQHKFWPFSPKSNGWRHMKLFLDHNSVPLINMSVLCQYHAGFCFVLFFHWF